MKLIIPKVSFKLLKKLLRKKNHGTSQATTTTALTTTTTPDSQDDATISPKNNKNRSPPQPPPPEECPICHDPVGITNPEGITEAWTKLHCGHKFGTHCIQTWLQESINRDPNTNPSCPICRTTAKHPCGHLISPPAFPSLHLDWQSPRAPPPPPPPPPPAPRRHYHHHNQQQQQQVRRRLTRRAGHPLRPPPAPRRRAQVVGECRTCAENAAFDERMRRIREQRQRERERAGGYAHAQGRRRDTAEPSATAGAGGGGGSAAAAAAIKAMIPGLKRSKNAARATVVHISGGGSSSSGGGGGGGGEDGDRPRERDGRARSSMFCAGVGEEEDGMGMHGLARQMHRRPTPPPGYGAFSRRLSI